MVNERRLPDFSPGHDGNEIDLRLLPSSVQESDVVLSTKTSLPVTGNLATEIFFGTFQGYSSRCRNEAVPLD